ncbi:paraquat-inducible protein A [Solemya velesiana gill symbiont]|nr:paraquat-inducible protein A [Solemya velesiana gill symbiont]
MSKTEKLTLNTLLILAAILIYIGLTAPMITIEKFIFISNSFSVSSGVAELYRNGETLLFLIIGIFSILLPILKLLLLFMLTNPLRRKSEKMKRYLHLVHEYGRWSMLDVFVVAVMVVSVKLDAIAKVYVHSGLYAFGAAVLLTMLVTAWVVRLSYKAEPVNS